jgi:hypothetical protein
MSATSVLFTENAEHPLLRAISGSWSHLPQVLAINTLFACAMFPAVGMMALGMLLPVPLTLALTLGPVCGVLASAAYEMVDADRRVRIFTRKRLTAAWHGVALLLPLSLVVTLLLLTADIPTAGWAKLVASLSDLGALGTLLVLFPAAFAIIGRGDATGLEVWRQAARPVGRHPVKALECLALLALAGTAVALFGTWTLLVLPAPVAAYLAATWRAEPSPSAR